MISYKSMFFISILVIYCLPVSRGFLPTRSAYRLNSLDFSQRESRQLSLETNQEPKPGESYTLNKDIVNNLEASPTQSLQILRLRYELLRAPLSSQEIQIIQSLLSQYLLSIQLITLPANTATVNLFQHFNRVKQILPKLLYSLGNLKSISPSWYLQKERDMIMQILSTYYSSNIKGFKSNNNSNNLSKSQLSSSSNALSSTSNINNKNQLLYFDGLALSDIFIGLCRLKISPYFLLNKSSFIDNIQHELQRLLNPFPASSTSSTSTSETSESSATPHYVLVGDLLWYFGSFSIKWSSLPQSLQSILLLSYQSGVSNFASSSLASSIWAFAKMGIQWRQFSDQLQNLILNKISQSMSKFTSQQAMKVLWSLSTLGVRFSQTSMSMIESLLSKVLLTGYTPKIPPSNSNTAITTSSDIVDATVTTASPTAPSATEDATEGKESDAKIIPSTAELLLQQDSASSISQGLMALAKMKIRWNDILQYSNRKYYPTLLSSNQNNNPTHAASVVDPPSSMVSIENMDLVNKMLDRFQYICLSYNSVAISNSIWALGTMGLKLGQISSTSSTSPSIYSPNGGNIADYYNAATVVTDVRDVTKTMLQTILRILPECNAWTFTNILSGLSLMKFSWFDLPSSLQETMIATILRLRYQMNTIDICTILYALAELDCTIEGLPSYFIDNILAPILRNLSSMNGNELSNIISSMSALGISWNMLPAEIQWSINSGIRREYMNMTAHALGNTVYGITMMCFDAEDTSDVSFRGVHETLLDAVIEKIKGINLAASDLPLATKTTVNSRNDVIEEEDLFNYRIYCHYIHIMQYITNPRRIPLSLLNYQLNRNQMKERQHRHSYKPDISPMQWEIEEEEKEKQEQEETLKKSNKDDRTKLREEELVKVFGFVTPIRYTEREKHERAIIQYYQKSSIVITTNTSKISNLQEEIYDHLLQAIDTLSANQILPSSMTSSQSSYSPSSSYYIEEEMSNSGSTSLEDSFLANKKIVVSKEVSYFDGLFPLDLVIRLEDLPSNATIIPLTSLLLAVIEVNGPSHYTKSYQQKLKRKDKYKEIIYKRLFSYINEMNNYYPIQYMHMKYNEIQYIGARQLCNELMITLIEKVIQYYQSLYFIPSYYYYKYPSLYNLKNYLWKLQQQLNEFFNWGLKK